MLALSVGTESCVPKMEGPNVRPNQNQQTDSKDDNLPTEVNAELVEAAQANELMTEKALELREATAVEQGRFRSAIYLYSAQVEQYAASPEVLAARLALLGIKDIYLSVTRPVLLSGADEPKRTWYRTFIKSAHDYKMKVYAMRLSNNRVFVEPAEVEAEVAAVKAWNSSEPSAQIDGISADLEPHTMKADNSYAQQLGYWWDSANNYGVGGSNDKLVGLTLDRLAAAKNGLGELALCEAVFSAFQPKYAAGELSRGGAKDFLEVCDWVMVMAYRTTAENIWRDVEHYLRAADRCASVSAAVKVTQNELDSVSPSLVPLGWDGMLDAIEYVVERGQVYDAFRGIDFFQYAGLEKMWQE